MVFNFNIKEQLNQFLKAKIESDSNKAEIISAYKLSPEEIDKIKNSFPEITKFNINNLVDKSVIAGFILKYGSYVIDLSVADTLKNFKKLFHEIT